MKDNDPVSQCIGIETSHTAQSPIDPGVLHATHLLQLCVSSCKSRARTQLPTWNSRSALYHAIRIQRTKPAAFAAETAAATPVVIDAGTPPLLPLRAGKRIGRTRSWVNLQSLMAAQFRGRYCTSWFHRVAVLLTRCEAAHFCEVSMRALGAFVEAAVRAILFHGHDARRRSSGEEQLTNILFLGSRVARHIVSRPPSAPSASETDTPTNEQAPLLRDPGLPHHRSSPPIAACNHSLCFPAPIQASPCLTLHCCEFASARVLACTHCHLLPGAHTRKQCNNVCIFGSGHPSFGNQWQSTRRFTLGVVALPPTLGRSPLCFGRDRRQWQTVHASRRIRRRRVRSHSDRRSLEMT